MKAIYWNEDDQGLTFDSKDVPDELLDRCSKLREEMVEAAAEANEELMDAYTAVSGSGPAYIYYMVEAMIDAGIQIGIDPENAKKLIDTGVTGIAYETVTSSDGSMPLLAPMSTIAGQLAFIVGSYHLLKHNKGKGVMIGRMEDIEPRVVTVVGAGVAGTQSISKALDNNALVKVLDTSELKLQALEKEFGSKNIERTIWVS